MSSNPDSIVDFIGPFNFGNQVGIAKAKPNADAEHSSSELEKPAESVISVEAEAPSDSVEKTKAG